MRFFCIKDFEWVKAGQICMLVDYHDPYDNRRTVHMWGRQNGHMKDFEIKKDIFTEYFAFIGF